MRLRTKVEDVPGRPARRDRLGRSSPPASRSAATGQRTYLLAGLVTRDVLAAAAQGPARRLRDGGTAVTAGNGPVILTRGLTKRYGRVHGGRRRRPRRARRRPVRVPRPERLGQDDDGADAARSRLRDQRRDRGARAGRCRGALRAVLPRRRRARRGARARTRTCPAAANLTLMDAAAPYPGGPGRLTAGRDRRRRVREALETVGLAAVGRRPVKAFSLGMRQRLGHRRCAAAAAAAARARRADERPRPAGDHRDARPVRAAQRERARRCSCPATCWPRSRRCAPGSGSWTGAGWSRRRSWPTCAGRPAACSCRSRTR